MEQEVVGWSSANNADGRAFIPDQADRWDGRCFGFIYVSRDMNGNVGQCPEWIKSTVLVWIGNHRCSCRGAAELGFIPNHLYLGEIFCTNNRHLPYINSYSIMRKRDFVVQQNTFFLTQMSESHFWVFLVLGLFQEKYIYKKTTGKLSTSYHSLLLLLYQLCPKHHLLFYYPTIFCTVPFEWVLVRFETIYEYLMMCFNLTCSL